MITSIPGALSSDVTCDCEQSYQRLKLLGFFLAMCYHIPNCHRLEKGISSSQSAQHFLIVRSEN